MTDLGRGYGSQGSQPWHPGDPGHADPQNYPQGYPQQVQQAQQAWPAQQPYGEQGWPQQGPYPQQPAPNPQQPGNRQPGFPQQGGPGGAEPFPPQPYDAGQWQQPYVQPEPVGLQQSAGPGPDGIDWEAEAADLEAADLEAADLEAGARPEDEEWVEEPAEEGEYGEEGDLGGTSFFGERDTSRETERERTEKTRKSGRRNSGACLLVTLVLLGALGGASWWGYGFYQKHFGPPPDYVGNGFGAVDVQIPTGSSGVAMGVALKAADVVKSAGAFDSAYGKNSKAGTIQPGSYTLRHQMSGAAAVQLLIDSAGGSAVIIPEGLQATEIYTKIDSALKLQPGTTAAVAKAQVNDLGLPSYANGNPEGFLWPAKYSIGGGVKPEDLLKQMVSNAIAHYQGLNLDAAAQKIGLQNGYQVVTEASILQREGNNPADFGKIARVLYNRLNTNATQGKLQLDTTLQYALGRTNFTWVEKNTYRSPYNTYLTKGLPPTPISNPGDDAIQAVLNPTPGNWAYFVAVSETDTRFDETFTAFKKDVKDYCTAHNRGFNEAEGGCT